MEWQKRYGKQGLVIIALSQDPLQMQKKFKEGVGINYLLVQWQREKMPKPLSLVFSYPTNLLIDRQGRLREFVFGPNLQALEPSLKSALKEKPPAVKGKPSPKTPISKP